MNERVKEKISLANISQSCLNKSLSGWVYPFPCEKFFLRGGGERKKKQSKYGSIRSLDVYSVHVYKAGFDEIKT